MLAEYHGGYSLCYPVAPSQFFLGRIDIWHGVFKIAEDLCLSKKPSQRTKTKECARSKLVKVQSFNTFKGFGHIFGIEHGPRNRQVNGKECGRILTPDLSSLRLVGP